MSKQKEIVLLAGVFLLGFVAARAQENVKRGKYEAGPQMAVVMNRTLANGKKVVLLKEVVPVLTLTDAEEQHSAPLSDGTNMVCRELYEYHMSDGTPKLAFICGNDTYLADDIGFIPKKDSKKYMGDQ